MVISKTPLRASFFGGGTDFKNYFENSQFGYGTVLSTAVDMHVYITVNKKFDDKIRICYSETEVVDHVDEVKHNIIREAMKMTGVDHGVEIIYMADLPLASAGIGMASSSAIAVGALNALFAYQGIHQPPEALARMACQLEIERLGNPIGIQDQYAVAYGGLRQYKFFGNGMVSAAPIICNRERLEILKNRLMLFFTGMTRDSSKIMREQNDTIEQKMQLLDKMVEETNNAYQILLEGPLDEWGYALNRVWEYKKQLANGISNPTIEKMYQAARAAGALGGKILGAGGGGFLLLYVPEECQKAVQGTLREYRLMEWNMEASGSGIIFSD